LIGDVESIPAGNDADKASAPRVSLPRSAGESEIVGAAGRAPARASTGSTLRVEIFCARAVTRIIHALRNHCTVKQLISLRPN
jgi:hypothetical protein